MDARKTAQDLKKSMAILQKTFSRLMEETAVNLEGVDEEHRKPLKDLMSKVSAASKARDVEKLNALKAELDGIIRNA
jgi:hypothetical protein